MKPALKIVSPEPGSQRTVSFNIPGKPVAKERPRLGKWGVYTPKRTQGYEQLVKTYALQAMQKCAWKPFEGPVALRVEINLRTRGRADLDNWCKSIGDALNGVVYVDDRQVIELVAYIGVVKTRKSDSVDVTVEEL